MPIITPEEAQAVLARYYPAFWAAVRGAFSRYFELNRAELGAIQERTKASYINDLVVKNVMEMLPEGQWQNNHGQRRMWLGGVICVRIKKVGRNLQPRNLATQAQFDFYDGLVTLQPSFDNMATAVPLFLAFTTNRLKTAPDRLFILCVKGVLNRRLTLRLQTIKPNIVWRIPVPDTERGLPLAQPPMPLQQPQKPSQPRVQAKEHKKARRDTRKEK